MSRIPWNKGITKYKPHPCLCGCGKLVKVYKYPRHGGGGFSYTTADFIKGHGRRGINGFNSNLHNPRLCLCGCGHYTRKVNSRYNRFIKGHENVGRVAWNKGKPFSEISRKKMSLARLGKEPANKIHIDLKKLRELYVEKKKSASLVSRELKIPIDAVKNRLKELGWSRSTKESCSTKKFKDLMRKIRIGILTSAKKLESPNRLEELVYKAINQFGISYQKQVPLFNKFVVDTLFSQKFLVLEIFGRYWHEMPDIKKKDFSKKKYLEKCGYNVEIIWDDEIKKNGIKYLLEKIFNKYNLI